MDQEPTSHWMRIGIALHGLQLPPFADDHLRDAITFIDFAEKTGAAALQFLLQYIGELRAPIPPDHDIYATSGWKGQPDRDEGGLALYIRAIRYPCDRSDNGCGRTDMVLSLLPRQW